MFVCRKVPKPSEHGEAQSGSELELPSPCRPPLGALHRDVPASSTFTTFVALPESPLGGMWSPPRPHSVEAGTPPVFTCGVPANIPLQHAPNTNTLDTRDVTSVIRILLSCIDICVVMVTMFIASTDKSESHLARRKQLKRRREEDVTIGPQSTVVRQEPEEDALDHPHVKQVLDLCAWHIGVEDAKWYVKPRSTCWFEEYLFNIYTPDMFYDILRMRRRTFDRLVHDLRPFI